MDLQNQTQTAPPEVVNNPVPEQNNFKLWYGIIATVIVLMVIFGSLWVFSIIKKQTIRTKTIQQLPTQTAEQTIQPSSIQPQPDQFAGWKTINKKNWILKIPPQWKYIDCEFSLLLDTTFEKDETAECNFDVIGLINIYKTTKDNEIPITFSTTNEATGEKIGWNVSNRRNFTIDGKNGIIQREERFGAQGAGKYISAYIKGDDSLYIFTLSDTLQEQTFFKILSTFLFTNSVDDSNKIYYQNPKYKYSFSYTAQNNFKAVSCNDYGSSPVYGDQRYIITDNNTSSTADDPYYTCGSQGEDHYIVVKSQQALDCQSTSAWSATQIALNVNGIYGSKCVKKFIGEGDIFTPSIIETVVVTKDQNFIQIEQFDNRAPETFNEILSSFKFD